MTRVLVDLIPAADERDQRRRDECAAADHPPQDGCHNPWMGVTFCPCGAARYPGNRRVLPEPAGVPDQYAPIRQRAVAPVPAPTVAGQAELFPASEVA